MDGLKKPVIKKIVCSYCGAKDQTSYMDREIVQAMEDYDACFGCAYWVLNVAKKNDPDSVRVDGHQYWIGPEDAHPSERGMDGSTYTIKFNDGRVAVTSNLWGNGEVPKGFRDALPDNARFI